MLTTLWAQFGTLLALLSGLGAVLAAVFLAGQRRAALAAERRAILQGEAARHAGELAILEAQRDGAVARLRRRAF